MVYTFREKLEKETALLDGAFGTYIWSLGITAGDFQGKDGCMEYLTFTSPQLITRVHYDYLEAGADAIETNTFGANRIKLDEYGLSEHVFDINKNAVSLAREVADSFSIRSFPRFVVATMGPTGKLPSSTDASLGSVTYAELKDVFHEQALGMIVGGADAILVETGQDLLEMRAAFTGAREAVRASGRDIIIMVQFTLANNGRMLLGTDASAVMSVFSRLGADVIGINCSTGPAEMESVVRSMSKGCPAYISCVPNAGLPVEKDGSTVYTLGAEEMALLMARFTREYKVDVIGGCCGTGPGHIKAMREKVDFCPGKRSVAGLNTLASSYTAVDLGGLERPVIVGERMNTQGSRLMKRLLLEEDLDGIVELAKKQETSGARMLDLCTVLTERQTEERDAVLLTKKVAESVKVPLMIDSTDPDVIAEALSSYPGTMAVNSINLEDGGRKAEKVLSSAAEHASLVVALTIDEKGMAKTVPHKLRCAKRIHDMATRGHAIAPDRLVFDTLTFSLGTGEKEYRASAVNTFKAITAIKKKFPGVLTILGVSNVSFGLPAEGRKVLNAAFLHNAVLAGLDMAIVNPASLIDYRDIPAEDRKAAEDLLFNRGRKSLEAFVEHFAGKEAPEKKAPEKKKELPLEERIKNCVIDRDMTAVVPVIDEALAKYSAEDIINRFLLEAMREVGEKLDSGEFVLPYVLQSAEVMNKALKHLEKHIPSGAGKKKGKVLLATVFGDVHDIGKNLVRMILSNSGFTVIDLGKQVPVETIIREAKKNKVDAVGLSALLVSTAMHMKTCVQALHDAGMPYPVLIGGAPTSHGFAKDISRLWDESVYRGGVFYAKDAFTGLKLAQALLSGEKQGLMDKYYAQFGTQEGDKEAGSRIADSGPRIVCEGRTRAVTAAKVPVPPFYGARSISNIPVDEVFGHLDERSLFELSWGAKIKDPKKRAKLIKEEYGPLLARLKEECLRKGWLDLKAVYGYFSCSAAGDQLKILDGKGKTAEVFSFKRSPGEGCACLADYFGENDLVAFQAVTIGAKMDRAIKGLDVGDKYSQVLYIHGLGVQLAEALASYMHDRIRKELSLSPGQGRRYSPGYPLWKDLSDQKKIFGLLDVTKRIGVTLTEAYQMVPEQSTTAMIVYNEKAEY